MKLAVHRHIYQKEKVQKQISSAKTKHYNNHIIDSSATELHSTMNELLGTAKSHTLPTFYSTAELPSMVSSFFSAKIQNVCDKCDQTALQLCPPDPPFSRTLLSCFHLVTEIDVSKTLKSMSFKSCELDPIPASLLTAFHTYFLPPLTSRPSASFTP